MRAEAIDSRWSLPWMLAGLLAVLVIGLAPRALAFHGPTGCVTITGTNSGEFLQGSIQCDHINARGGNDLVAGGNGKDGIHGDNGHDDLFGEVNDDNIRGDDGDDEINGGGGMDTCVGGPGLDSISFCEM